MLHLSLYPIADSYLLVLAAALVLVGLMAFGPPRSKTTPGRRWALAVLRLAVVALVVLAMLRPTLVYTEMKKQSATVVVLADQSRSMSVPDGGAGGKTRFQVLGQALADAERPLRALADEYDVKAYTFDADARPAQVTQGKIRLPESPDGRQTALGSVLEDVLRYEAGKRLLGVILLSDGAQRAYAPRDVPPQSAAVRLKHLGCPLYTFALGKSRGLGQARDVAVKELLVNPQVFVKNVLDVAAQVQVTGYTNRQVAVRLMVETAPGKMEAVAERAIQAATDGQLLPVHFGYVFQTPGEFKLSVEAAEQPGELVTTNNRLSSFVNVLKGGLKVYYLEGDLRVEQKFLRRALDASPDIHVDFARVNPLKPETKPPDLAERFQLGKYDVYILGDLDSRVFTTDELKLLAQTVGRGAGLIMLGGFHSFGPGGYGQTPLAQLLPVAMDRLERQDFNGPIRTDLHLPGPVKMLPSALGQRHFAMLLAGSEGESRALWEKLPPLDGANRFVRLAPLAVVLAAAGSDPLLVAHSFGTGRVMAFAGDSTWRWWMQGFESAHKRFWRQVVLWLARKDEAQEGSVWIKLSERRLAPNQMVEFIAGAQNSTGEPVTELSGQADLLLPDGSRRPVTLVRQGDVLSGNIRGTLAAGDYAVEVRAKQKDQSLGTARARFLVYAQDLELDDASADTALMETLAATTGGQSLAPEQLPELLRRLTQNATKLNVYQETKRSLWDTWPFFLALVALLAVEWFLRKRWGLV
jgi:uncharacterized membrane protein